MDKIIIKGAREHNLKNINLQLPKNQMIVFTGVSGSGKSSLAFDTIFAEGQRRYVESLSAYARQFLGQKDKPDVDSIEGLSPAISIDQKGSHHNPRSTVATVTEIYDYLRVLYARIGKPYCPQCGRKIERMTVDEIVDHITLQIQARLPAPKRSDGEAGTDKYLTILAPVVRGRKGEYHQLLYDLYMDGFSKVRINGELRSLGERIVLDRYRIHSIDVVVDEIPFASDKGLATSDKLPITRLTEAIELALNRGNNVVTIIFPDGQEQTISSKFHCPHCNVSFIEIEPRLFSFNSPYGACQSCTGLGTRFFWSDELCPACQGARLRPEALSVKIDDQNIVNMTRLVIREAYDFIYNLADYLSERELLIAERVITEIANRLKFLVDVGLDYISLDRKAGTLSGGEAQRIRLASQVGSRLTGVLYVLDEPTIGLHQRDTQRLVKTLHDLRDLGNTVIVVEHDPETILSSNYLVDIGPGAGRQGGEVVLSAPLKEALQKPNRSETIKYLTGQKSIDWPKQRRKPQRGFVKIVGARTNNLKNIDIKIPLGLFVCVTGVSGSGKSSLVEETLYKALAKHFYHHDVIPGKYARIEGLENINKVIVIDQSPIGRTPRSNPATYTGTFTPIRDLFSALPEARVRGYRLGRFSFNVRGGRCEACEGDGVVKIEMHFLPDVYVPCEICQGRRFNRETLEVKYKNHSIADVLDMTVAEALEFFVNIPAIADRLKTLNEVGLGYIKLGQPATTLSGGEAQRVKLSTELSKRATGRTLYILDEPTVGLHFVDVKQLIDVLQRLVSHGNTVIVIEHNLDVIKTADWIIDLGPEGGDRGGRVVAVGTPEDVTKNVRSYTGQFLRKVLKSN